MSGDPAISQRLGDAEEVLSGLQQLIPASDAEKRPLAHRLYPRCQAASLGIRDALVSSFESSRRLHDRERAREIRIDGVRLTGVLLLEGQPEGDAQIADPVRVGEVRRTAETAHVERASADAREVELTVDLEGLLRPGPTFLMEVL